MARAAVGRFLGDLLPTTRRVRSSLLKFYHEDPVIQDTHVVEVTSGRLRGFQASKGSALVFRGVPFATARRLEPPRAVEPWSGERSCFRFGPACPQPSFGLRMMFEEGVAPMIIEGLFPPLPPDQSYWLGSMREEECLNANIYTPSLDGKRPVLVWIHGGAFCMGSGVEGGFYEASRLSQKADAVVVSINYRLGPFGFLHFPDEGITNLGIRDQIAALEWVRDNVAKFGGDPGNVTVLGESAGGASVGTLLGSTKATGLFHRAVCISGGATYGHSARQWGHYLPLVGDLLKKETGGAFTPDAVRKLQPEQLISLVSRTMMKPIGKPLGTAQTLWLPYRDGDIVPIDGAHSALSDAVPLIVGVMDDEAKAFERFVKFKDESKALQATVENLRSYFMWTNKEDKPGDASKWEKHASRLYQLVEACRAERGLPTATQDVARGIQSLLFFEEPSYCLARDTGAFSYNLHFGDSGHGQGNPLLFRFRHTAGEELVLGSNKPPSEEDWHRSDQFVECLSSFAKSGRPRIEGAEWRPYPEIMHLKAAPEAKAFKEECLAFQDLKRDIVSDLAIDTTLPQNLAIGAKSP